MRIHYILLKEPRFHCPQKAKQSCLTVHRYRKEEVDEVLQGKMQPFRHQFEFYTYEAQGSQRTGPLHSRAQWVWENPLSKRCRRYSWCFHYGTFVFCNYFFEERGGNHKATHRLPNRYSSMATFLVDLQSLIGHIEKHVETKSSHSNH